MKDITIKKFKKLPSTQSKANELPLEERKPWTIIVAEEQTAGRGRKGNFWYSPQGGLYFSIILPKLKIEDLQILTILAAFIVAKILKEKLNLEPFIKFPNDVYLNGRKVSGVMTENVIGVSQFGEEVKFSVMGIGLNTNIVKFPPELKNIATSLNIEIGKEIDNEEILKQIIKELKEQLKTISE